MCGITGGHYSGGTIWAGLMIKTAGYKWLAVPSEVNKHSFKMTSAAVYIAELFLFFFYSCPSLVLFVSLPCPPSPFLSLSSPLVVQSLRKAKEKPTRIANTDISLCPPESMETDWTSLQHSFLPFIETFWSKNLYLTHIPCLPWKDYKEFICQPYSLSLFPGGEKTPGSPSTQNTY